MAEVVRIAEPVETGIQSLPQNVEAEAALLGALIIQMITTGIIILGIDQNYSDIIIGSVVIVAVVLDQLNNWIAKRRLAARAAAP